MQTKTLSTPTIHLIQNYLHLPFPGKKISCPYFNNRGKVRAGLRVLIGKGSANEIIEEANLISLREKIDIKNLSSDDLKHFLVDHNLGIDCSGFVYYVLDSELKARGKNKLKNYIKFPNIKNPVRKLLVKLRTIENVSVKTLESHENSTEVDLQNIEAGDMIIMMDAGLGSDRDHVLIVDQIDYENNILKKLHYTHSLNWTSDGKYNHGVKQGIIEITDINKSLREQKWIEQNKSDDENETFGRAKRAKFLSIMRLNCLNK